MAENAVIRNYATEEAILQSVLNKELELGQVVSCTNTLCLYRVIQSPEDQTVWTYEKITGGGEGVPLGTIIPFYGLNIPAGYLPCDGSQFNTDQYPALAMFLETNVLPDFRETVPVGIGQRASGVATHDIYTIGQFKDDQFQDHQHSGGGSASQVYAVELGFSKANPSDTGGAITGRHGSTTHGKQIGVNYIIKAIPTVSSEEADILFQSIKSYMTKQNKLSSYEELSTSTSEYEFTSEFDGFVTVNAYAAKPVYPAQPDQDLSVATFKTTVAGASDYTAFQTDVAAIPDPDAPTPITYQYVSVSIKINGTEIQKAGAEYGDLNVSVAVNKDDVVTVTPTNATTVSVKAAFYKEREY